MTDKELKKLTRAELLEMLLIQSRENQRLQAELDRMAKELEDRKLKVDRAGSIAEAALQVSGIFEAAQQAAEQYLFNLEGLSGRQEEICARMEEETRRKCDAMVEKARVESQQYWDQMSKRMEAFYASHAGLREMTADAAESAEEPVVQA